MPSISNDLLSSSEDLISQLQQSATALASVSRRLEEEFGRRFKDSQNPMYIIRRINKLEQGLPALRTRVQEVMSMKQELIDETRRKLATITQQLATMCSKSGCNPPSDDGAFAAYDKVLQEWDAAMARRQLDNSEPGQPGQKPYSNTSLTWAYTSAHLDAGAS